MGTSEKSRSRTFLALIVAVILGFVAIVFSFVAYDVIQDRQFKVIITGRVPFYKTFDDPKKEMFGVLDPNDSVTVLRIRYSKDYQFIKVKTADGRLGWIVSGDNFKLSD